MKIIFYKVVDPEETGTKTLASEPTNFSIPNFELNLNIPEWLENINAQNKLMEDLRKICELNVFDKIGELIAYEIGQALKNRSRVIY